MRVAARALWAVIPSAALVGASMILIANVRNSSGNDRNTLRVRYAQSHRTALSIRNALEVGTNSAELRRLLLELKTNLDHASIERSSSTDEIELHELYKQVVQFVTDGLYIRETMVREPYLPLRVRGGIESWENNVKTYYYDQNPTLPYELRRIVEQYEFSGQWLKEEDLRQVWSRAAQCIARAHSALGAG